jgi:hypothetical protein
MRPPVSPHADVDAFFAEVLRAGEKTPEIRGVLERWAPDEAMLVSVLRRAVPIRFLDYVGTVPPWSDHPLVLGAVVRNPRTPRVLGLKLLPYLFWHDVAEAAASPWIQSAIRTRAEGILKDMLPEMRLGERISFGRLATPSVLPLLLADEDPKVVTSALDNPRLREADLLTQIRSNDVRTILLETVGASSRWGQRYGVRLGLVLQPRTPLALALAQISSLVKRDLIRVSEGSGLRPVVQAAALRMAAEPELDRRSRRSAT